ncbi:hypothetical protein F5884DRAFT_72172 [Xylogone sp. PMI_703]|nr:hypothetical protein F5884DRAFT_72172 [Xylogone sp. PMI_703]
MHFGNTGVRHHRRAGVVETRTTKPTLMTRLRGPNARTKTVKTTTTVEPTVNTTGGAAPVTTTRRRGYGTTGWGRRRGARTGAGVGVGTTGAGVGTTGGVRRRRNPTLGDKISGAMLKLKGTLTNRPGKKAAGTRRMRGTQPRRVY